MEIVIKNSKSKYLEIFSLLDLDNIQETFKSFSSIKEPFEAKIFVVNESISSHQLSKLKNLFDKINICSLCIYSNNRDTVLSGKSLKIDSAFIKEQEIKNKLLSNLFSFNVLFVISTSKLEKFIFSLFFLFKISAIL